LTNADMLLGTICIQEYQSIHQNSSCQDRKKKSRSFIVY